MKSLDTIIQSIRSKKKGKILLAIFMVSRIFFSTTFAQDTQATSQWSEVLRNLQLIIQKLIEFAGWIRIVLAALAGKFMTNDLVYGSRLHMDVYLRKLRNIFKNFANFWLLGILLREVIKDIKNISANAQKIIKNALVAGILIQSSRFLIAVLIDISTIATAAIGSFPANFIDSNAVLRNTMEKQIEKNRKSFYLKLDKDGKMTTVEVNNTTNQDEILKNFVDSILPKPDIISWPLIYIGATTLRIQEALSTNQDTSIPFGKVVTGSLLQVSMILLYCATLILLLIANIIRVGLLRIIIPLSPILVLFFATGQKGIEKLGKDFNLYVILDMIFKPVIFTAILSLILIFIVSIQNIMSKDNGWTLTIQGTTFTSNKTLATMDIHGVSKVTINDTVFDQAGDAGKNIFSNIIIYFATMFLLRYLVKSAVKSGWWTIGSVMEKTTNLMETMATTVPILWKYSTRAILEWGRESLATIGRNAGINLNIWSTEMGKIKRSEEYEKRFEGLLGPNERTPREELKLEEARSMKNFLNTTNDILQNKSLGYTENPETFNKRENAFNKVLNNREQREQNEFWVDKNIYFEKEEEWDKNTPLKLENMSQAWFTKLSETLFGETWEAPINYEQFKNKIFGTRKQ
jgi:hypothetical protein